MAFKSYLTSLVVHVFQIMMCTSVQREMFHISDPESDRLLSPKERAKVRFQRRCKHDPNMDATVDKMRESATKRKRRQRSRERADAHMRERVRQEQLLNGDVENKRVWRKTLRSLMPGYRTIFRTSLV